MGQTTKIFGSATLMLIIGSGSAVADVTAEQVWDNWRNFSTDFGQTITTGAETRSGDRLTVTDLTFSIEDADVALVGKLGEIVFREMGDGRVEITMSPSYIVSVNGGGGSDAILLDLLINQTDLTMIASGDTSEIRYDIAASAVSIGVDRFEAQGEDATIAGGASLTGLSGVYVLGRDGNDVMQTSVAATGVNIDISATSPENEGVASIVSELRDLSITTNGTKLSELIEMGENITSLPQGFSVEARYRLGSGSYKIDFKDRRTTFNADVQTSANTFDLLFDASKMLYGVAIGATEMSFSGSEVPLPEVALATGGIEFRFEFPIGKSAVPQDFSLATRLLDLTVSPDIWGMFDPAVVLPRDPATFILDIAGKANVLVDLFDEQAMAQFGSEVPGELHELTLSELKLSAAGTDVSGSGAFTFDNNDLVTFDGLPAPTGEINLTVVGANGLIDKLVSLGFLPDEQAMGARMMLGLFARPGGGEDTLTSKIEVRGDGSVFANEQRLK